MFLSSLAFLCGIILLQHFSFLPNQSYVFWIILIIFFTRILSNKFWKYTKYFAISALGFAWCLYYVHLQTAWTLPANLEGKTFTITGYIASIPEQEKYRSTFLFSLYPAHALVHLSWQNNKVHLHVGDQWQFSVRLKKIHSTMNPGGFDYEAWSIQEGIRANGYVVNKNNGLLLSSHWYHYPLGRIRQYLYDKMIKHIPLSTTSPWLIALAVGERHGIKAENWQILRNTGTNHLMAIAGLHIGFMSAFAYGFVAFFWRRIPALVVKMPAQHAGSIAALCFALIYSALAGFSIPTQRACIMLSSFLIILLLRRRVPTWQGWGLALYSVLFINPLSVLTESFWLSFASVALIIYAMDGRLAPQGWWWKWGRIQWVITLGLIPLSIGLFQQCSLISFVANSIAIPWVGFLIVPMTLLGCFVLLFSSTLGSFILSIADKMLHVLWSILTYFAHLSWATWYQAVPHEGFIILACIGVFILLVPAGFPGRWVGIIGLLPLILYKPVQPKLGEVWFTLLDVGQGLSAVIQTKKHVLVFDTGAKLSDNYDMGASVVLPFLRAVGVKHIDMLVISHGDNDHSGGANAVLQQLPVYLLKTSVPERFSFTRVDYCLSGQRWQWDEVNFTFLYPPADKLGLDNDSSCVLRIVDQNGKRILLTGDIEKLAERYLVNTNPENLAADILVAPHHGSKTSAVDAFLQAVHPRIVLFPVGYRNRYHFPHALVIKKYQDLGVISYDTVRAGAIQFQLGEASRPPSLYRLQHKHYWND